MLQLVHNIHFEHWKKAKRYPCGFNCFCKSLKPQTTISPLWNRQTTSLFNSSWMKWFTWSGPKSQLYNALSLTIHCCSVYSRASVILVVVTTYDVDVISALVISYSSFCLTESLSCRDLIDEEVEPDSCVTDPEPLHEPNFLSVPWSQSLKYMNYEKINLHMGWLV